MVTAKVSPAPRFTAPVTVGVRFWVTWDTTVGIPGGVVSMISSLVLMSSAVWPAPSVTLANTE